MARSRAASPARSRSKSPARPPRLAPGKHTLVNPLTGKAMARVGDTREEVCALANRGGLRKKDCAGSEAEAKRQAAKKKKAGKKRTQ